jgi:hypothetical protein
VAGSAFTTQPVVTARDASNNVVTSFSGQVTLAIKSGGTSGAALGGTNTVTAVNGVATFSGLSIDKDGSAYILSAGAAGLTSGDSLGFDVTAAPRRLLGASWNAGRSVEELLTIDPATGQITVLGDITGLATLPSGVAVQDSTNDRLYLHGNDSSVPTGLPRLYISNTQTGAFVASSPISRSLMALVREDGTGRLLGAWKNTDRDIEELLSIDPSTGQATVLGDITGLVGTSSGVAALDSANNRFYMFGVDGSSTTRLYISNTQTGALVASPQIARHLAALFVETGTGRLLGAWWNATRSVEELVVIDPSTGQATLLGDITGLAGLSSGVAALDSANQRLYVYGVDGSSNPKLFVMNTQTGALVTSLPLTRTPTILVLD